MGLKSPLKIYLFAAIGLIAIVLGCAVFSITEANDFELAKQEIVLRKIGHEVLLQSGDSTSRVLPVTKISENDYQIRFEKEFTFHPDSLVKIVSHALNNDKSANDYVVNVLNCSGTEVVFGYSMSKNGQDKLVPCSGRKQPLNCYRIDLIFKGGCFTAIQKGYLIGGLPFLAFLGLMISKSFKIRRNSPEKASDENVTFELGKLTFDSAQRQITFNDAITELTSKENKLMLIFAKSPNLVIERSRFQKEIWEDEGVIVGRSLDVFISKLRKKLELDASVKLVNIHGKGYKLEII
ncbi:transcriptional regulator [Pedobacter sp. Leaf176]|nr:transcriptional regulator [Pedobacter sp. Leaf176]